MERIGNKVSYIKKPFAKNSFVAAGLAAAALVFYAAAISFSYYTQGNAPLAAAALGFCSIIIAVSSVVYGVFAMMEKEKNYLLAKITGRNREQRSGAHLFQVRKMNVKWRHDTWNKI